ncbi:hypothetical protein C8F04DRAFT_1274102 [Mycena alexandri]|uniref:Uncharacterized protein n=1 Tax=Mycena alexandri TaxID=1745969 RepID=A0AAD6WU72_9AGAR|nr:hypothetical protein C8F04DRAFT_1274102 [Mycena alexandri]
MSLWYPPDSLTTLTGPLASRSAPTACIPVFRGSSETPHNASSALRDDSVVCIVLVLHQLPPSRPPWVHLRRHSAPLQANCHFRVESVVGIADAVRCPLAVSWHGGIGCVSSIAFRLAPLHRGLYGLMYDSVQYPRTFIWDGDIGRVGGIARMSEPVDTGLHGVVEYAVRYPSPIFGTTTSGAWALSPLFIQASIGSSRMPRDTPSRLVAMATSGRWDILNFHALLVLIVADDVESH